MKKFFFLTATILTVLSACCVSASAAVVNDTVKVGLFYGSDALYSANLENSTGYGSGYYFGYYDEYRNFQQLAVTEETQVSVTVDGNIGYDWNMVIDQNAAAYTLGGYHIQLSESFYSYDMALMAAEQWRGFFNQSYVAYSSGVYYVRLGAYTTEGEAWNAMSEAVVYGLNGSITAPSMTGVTVTATKTDRILFQFDYSGIYDFAILPKSVMMEKTVTWFKNYRYNGGFEYNRVTGGNLAVMNVVPLEDYVKGVIPYEMGGDWPMEALKAQAVCARTYVMRQTKHDKTYGFDVCNGTDCQVYRGVGAATATSDAAVDMTAGQMGYYNGQLASMVYYSSNGGASEGSENVWGTAYPYLTGKADPYEPAVQAQIKNYTWSVSYTADELTAILQKKGYDIGTVSNVYVAEYTPMGNVLKLVFQDIYGREVTVQRDVCRTVFYSSELEKSVRSLRFTIDGGSAGKKYTVNGSQQVALFGGVYVLSGGGMVSQYSDSGENTYVITSSGVEVLEQKQETVVQPRGVFTISGTGYGHNVGMSQWGAYAMAQQGYSYRDILNFYYNNCLTIY